MMRLMKADMYRILRSKGVYISIGLMIGYLTITLLAQAQGSIGVVDTSVAAVEQAEVVWTGMQTVRNVLSNVLILQYFLIIYFVVITGADFSMNTYKNVVTVGMSRWKYYLSKLTLIAICSLVMGTLYYGYSFGLASLVNGVGDNFTFGFFQETFIGMLLPQLVLMFAYVSLTVMLLNITQSQSFAISFFAIAPIVILIVSSVIPALNFLGDYEMSSGLNAIGTGATDTAAIFKYLITAIGVIVISTIVGITLFQKKDL